MVESEGGIWSADGCPAETLVGFPAASAAVFSAGVGLQPPLTHANPSEVNAHQPTRRSRRGNSMGFSPEQHEDPTLWPPDHVTACRPIV